MLGDGCIVTRFLQCTWKLQRTPRRTCRRRCHTVRRTAPRVFFCSILAWYHWWEFFSVKFGNFTPHRKNKQKVAWRKSTALPTERRPLFFLCKPQQQIVWTKHTAALTRRVIHKRLSFTGVPLVFVSAKRKAFYFNLKEFTRFSSRHVVNNNTSTLYHDMLNQKMAGTDGARRHHFLRDLLSYTIIVVANRKICCPGNHSCILWKFNS